MKTVLLSKLNKGKIITVFLKDKEEVTGKFLRIEKAIWGRKRERLDTISVDLKYAIASFPFREISSIFYV